MAERQYFSDTSLAFIRFADGRAATEQSVSLFALDEQPAALPWGPDRCFRLRSSLFSFLGK